MQINQKRADFIINSFYFIILAVLLWLTLKYAVGLILPFIIAFTIAALVHRISLPLSERVRRLSYPAAAAVTATILFATVGVVIFIIGTALFNQFADFALHLPELISSMSDLLISTVRDWLDSIPGKTACRI